MPILLDLDTIIATAHPDDIEAYKEELLKTFPSSAASSTWFSLGNAQNWLDPTRYTTFVASRRRQSGATNLAGPSTSPSAAAASSRHNPALSESEPPPIESPPPLSHSTPPKQCNGAAFCSEFDFETLDSYERYGSDSETSTAWYPEVLDQQAKETSTVSLRTITFFNMLMQFHVKCKKTSCGGHLVIRTRSSRPDDNGNREFVGCSDWDPKDQYDHTYVQWTTGVDKQLLKQLLSSKGDASQLPDTPPCALMKHPSEKLKHCHLPHIRNGQVQRGVMVKRECPTRMTIYAPTSDLVHICKAFVEIVNPHSHPNHPPTKVSFEAKDVLSTAIQAHGARGITAGKLLHASTTKQGKSLGESHPALLKTERIRNATVKARRKENPHGEDWMALWHQADLDSKVPKQERYIWKAMQEEDIKLCVTMEPYLAKTFVLETYAVMDFTFKRTHGELNEWEVVLWHPRHNMRISAGRLWCNKATRQAFKLLWKNLFWVIWAITGVHVRYKAIRRNGNLIGNLLDAEAAQAQGLGDVLAEQLSDFLMELSSRLCCTHYNRDVAKISCSPEDQRRFLDFSRLTDPERIREFFDWLQSNENEGIRRWYINKKSYPWYWGGYNGVVSYMPGHLWDLLPNHTNLSETAHKWTNQFTGVGLTPLNAVLSAREIDRSVAKRLQALETNAIRHPTTTLSMLNKNANRQTSRALRKVKAEEGAHGIAMTEEKIAEAEVRKKEIEEELRKLKADNKSLKAEVKAAKGHVRRKASATPTTRKPSSSSMSTYQTPQASAFTSTPPMLPTSSFDSSSQSAIPLPNTEPQMYTGFQSTSCPAFPSPNTIAYDDPLYAPSSSVPYLNIATPSSHYVSRDAASESDAFSALGEITFN
ncbi:hypothetical protein FS837_012691 [Tulasnella sp. UAMH 9824]|nr:hypothetical protein FS837_012691 [Tulasnella sp. UAMH 9824]